MESVTKSVSTWARAMRMRGVALVKKFASVMVRAVVDDVALEIAVEGGHEAAHHEGRRGGGARSDADEVAQGRVVLLLRHHALLAQGLEGGERELEVGPLLELGRNGHAARAARSG